MTPPPKGSTYGAGGFSEQHRLRSAYVLKAPSEPSYQYVQSRVLVAVSSKAACAAPEITIPERNLDERQRPTTTAHLCGICRVHPLDLRASLCRFTAQNVHELTPAHVVRALSKPRASDAFDIQILNVDRPVTIHETPSDLMMKVAPLISDMMMQTGHVPARLAPAVRTFLPPRHTALKAAKLLLRPPEVLGRLYRLSLGGDEKSLPRSMPTGGLLLRSTSTGPRSQESTTYHLST